VDSIPLLKAYSQTMNAGPNWFFVTGSKDSLYKMARESYLLDNEKNTSMNIQDQFIHTQFFAVVDKEGRVRGVYDGLKNDEVEKLSKDIKDLLREKKSPQTFNNSTFRNTPN
jgi:protein SCO1/2